MKNRNVKKLSLLVVFVLAMTSIFSFVPAGLNFVHAEAIYADDLFISEYIEGSSFNKAIEIFNGTGADVDLSSYSLELYSNGSATASNTVTLNGTLLNGDVYVLAHSQAGVEILAVADMTNSSVINFNGDDAVVLKNNGEVIDVFGQVGFDPGSSWGTGDYTTVDHTLIRKSSISSGDIDGSDSFDPSIEWNSYPKDTFTQLGTHTMDGFDDGGPGEDPVKKVANVTALPAPGGVEEGTEVMLSTSTEDATVYYAVYTDGVTDIDFEIFDGNNPIVVNEDLTIEAYATKDGLEDSDITEFIYTIKEPATLITIAEAIASPIGTEVTVEGIVTTKQGSGSSKAFYIQDDTAGTLVFTSNDYSINRGDKVRVKGTTKNYNNFQFELDYVEVTLVEANIGEPSPRNIGIDDLGEIYEGQLVRFENVLVKEVTKDSYNNAYITVKTQEAEATVKLDSRTGYSYDNITYKAGDIINAVGVVENYGVDKYRILIRDLSDLTLGELGEDTIAPTITHTPVTEGNVNENLIITATVTDNKKVESVKLYFRIKGTDNYTIANMTKAENEYGYTIPKEALTIEGIEYYIEAFDGTNTATSPEDASVPYEIVISDEDILAPEVKNLTPASGSSTGDDLRPTISAEYSDESGINTESVKLYLDDVDITVDATITETKITYVPEADLIEGNHTIILKVSDNAPTPQTAIVEWNFYVGERLFNLYFGQLHSHTAENSDGAGTLTEAYSYARDVARLDFFAVTDHSNSFDTAPSGDKYGTYNLGDYNKNNPKWQNGQRAAAEALTENFISVYGYEMTWSGGPGHMNTFATEGFVSRNNTELNNKSNDSGLKTYYQLLKDTPNSISQFNHPGKTFGTFSEFAYLDPIIDARISLIEVGNGEGAVGSGAYFRSYEEYTKALDKGWHLAPTNNQDNHKKKWGDANTARTVIYTDDLSVEGLYDALRDMRVYATEDNNLEIIYTLNDEILGTIVDTVPEVAEFSVSITDPDSSDKIETVSIISNGGKVVLSKTFRTQNAYFEETIENPTPGYYYVKVVQEDGQIAVTAPIWLGSAPKVGISNAEHNKMMPVTNEPLKLTTTLFNNELEAVTIKSINYEIKNGDNIRLFELNEDIAGSGEVYTHELDYTFTQPGIFTVVITAVISQNGNDVTYSKELEVNVRDSEKLIYVGIDASHNNEYVSGNYKASMGNFGQLAAKYDVRTVELNTSEELISALQNPKYQMMVFTVPSRRDGSTGRIPFKSYSQAEIDAIAGFAKAGKAAIITGWGDYYESYSNLKSDPNFTADEHMAAQQNKLLSAIGAKLRLADDEAKDDALNGGQPQRLYLTDHNNYLDPFTEGVVEEQVFSQYGGSTVFAVDSNSDPVDVLPSNISPIISGHDTTYSTDDDGDGNGVPPKYNDRVLIMANETVTHEDGTKSTVIVSGGAFMSNFEIQVEIENAGTLPYSNYNILENIIISLKNTTSIADVHRMPMGSQVIIEGIATTDVYDGSDSNKGFFDCIYIQDSTGGINLFPVSSGVQAGQKIRVLGKISEYQDEKQIQVENITVLDSSLNPVPPKEVTPKEAMSSENTGSLVKFTGYVTEIVKDNDGVVGQLMVGGARVYINGYITKNISLSNIKVGDQVEVIGISSIGENMSSDTEFLPRIRIRDRAEIVKVSSPGGDIPEPSKPKEEKKEKSPIELGLIVVEGDIKSSLIAKILDEKETKEIFSHLTSIEFQPVSDIFDITSSKKLDKPFKLIIKYDKNKVIDSQKLGVYYFNETTKVWEYIGGKVIKEGEIEVTIDHLSNFTVMEYRKTFNDISNVAWAQKQIEVLAAKHIINGIDNKNYAPNNNLTRAQFAKLVVEGLNLKLEGQIVSFSDVKAGAWYKDSVETAASLGIVAGYDGKFDPDGLITREQMATMIVRALKYVEPNADYTTGPTNFTDQGQISEWAMESVAISANKGLVKGLGNGLFGPKEKATRAQAAVIIYQMLEVLDRL